MCDCLGGGWKICDSPSFATYHLPDCHRTHCLDLQCSPSRSCLASSWTFAESIICPGGKKAALPTFDRARKLKAQLHNIMNLSFADVIILTTFPVLSSAEYSNLFFCPRNFCPGVSLPAQDLLKLLCPQDPLPPRCDPPQTSRPCEEREEHPKGT